MLPKGSAHGSDNDSACLREACDMARQNLLNWFLATALALTPMPAAAHDAAVVFPLPSQQLRAAERAVVGLSIFTSDGKEIGKALATGTDENGLTVLVAEIERPLGMRPIAVAIPTDSRR